MQQDENKIKIFNKVVGDLVKEIRLKTSSDSLNQFAREYDFDRGNFSKLERGIISCRLITAWKFAEASGIKFSEFAKMIEDKLEKDFKLIEE